MGRFYIYKGASLYVFGLLKVPNITKDWDIHRVGGGNLLTK